VTGVMRVLLLCFWWCCMWRLYCAYLNMSCVPHSPWQSAVEGAARQEACAPSLQQHTRAASLPAGRMHAPGRPQGHGLQTEQPASGGPPVLQAVLDSGQVPLAAAHTAQRFPCESLPFPYS
jgi:hypothetical protein